MAKRRKNPSGSALFLVAAGGAALYLLLRKTEVLTVPAAEAKQVQENLNRFYADAPLPVTGVYDAATHDRFAAFCDWAHYASINPNKALSGYSLLAAKSGIFAGDGRELVTYKIADKMFTVGIWRSAYDYFFRQRVAGPDSGYTETDKQAMMLVTPKGVGATP